MDLKEMLEEVIYLKIEKDKETNLFNNLNNFSRDHYVFKQTLKHCMFFFEEIVEERDRYRKGMQHYYGKLQEKN